MSEMDKRAMRITTSKGTVEIVMLDQIVSVYGDDKSLESIVTMTSGQRVMVKSAPSKLASAMGLRMTDFSGDSLD